MSLNVCLKSSKSVLHPLPLVLKMFSELRSAMLTRTNQELSSSYVHLDLNTGIQISGFRIPDRILMGGASLANHNEPDPGTGGDKTRNEEIGNRK